MVDRKIAKKKVSRRGTAEAAETSKTGTAVPSKRRGRPPKKASASTAADVKTRRGRPPKNDPAPADGIESRSRRGRPVSVEALKARYARTQEALKAEKAKRRKQSQEMKIKFAAAAAAKKKLKAELVEVKAALAKIRENEKSAAEQAKMEFARDDAVKKFVTRWEKEYLASMTKKHRTRGRKRRGRPPKSR